MIKAAKEFENRIKDERRSRIKRYPCYTNRASEIGHPCERYLYFNRTEWDKTELHDEGLQAIFDEGHHQEKEVIKTLMAADIEVFHQQTAVSRDALFKKYNISGHMDLKVRVADRAIPCDVKSMAPHYFESVNTQADFENHSAPHIRKYIAQLMIYSIGSDEEYGYMILKNKSTGQIKFVLVKIDFGYVESLIQKAERINGYVATKTPPRPSWRMIMTTVTAANTKPPATPKSLQTIHFTSCRNPNFWRICNAFIQSRKSARNTPN